MEARLILLFAFVVLSGVLCHGPPHIPPGHFHGPPGHQRGPRGPHHHDWSNEHFGQGSNEWQDSGPDSGSDSGPGSGSWEEGDGHNHHHHPWDSGEHGHPRPPPGPPSHRPGPPPPPGHRHPPPPGHRHPPPPGHRHPPPPGPPPPRPLPPPPGPGRRPNGYQTQQPDYPDYPGQYPQPNPNQRPRPPFPQPQPIPEPNGDGQVFPRPNQPNQPNQNRPGRNPNLRPNPPRPADLQTCLRNCPLTPEYNPVCGTDGVTYDNAGRLECARSCGVDVRMQISSRCPTNGGVTSTSTSSPLPNTRGPSPPNLQACLINCPVTSEYNPVCGTNGVTYNNPGRLDCAKMCGVDVQLSRSSRCPPNMPTQSPITNVTPIPSSPSTGFTISQEDINNVFTSTSTPEDQDGAGQLDIRYERVLTDDADN